MQGRCRFCLIKIHMIALVVNFNEKAEYDLYIPWFFTDALFGCDSIELQSPSLFVYILLQLGECRARKIAITSDYKASWLTFIQCWVALLKYWRVLTRDSCDGASSGRFPGALASCKRSRCHLHINREQLKAIGDGIMKILLLVTLVSVRSYSLCFAEPQYQSGWPQDISAQW